MKIATIYTIANIIFVSYILDLIFLDTYFIMKNIIKIAASNKKKNYILEFIQY